MQKRMLVTAVALATLLGACSSPATQHTVSSSPSATPVFASDAEALAAAEAAYAKYQAMEDTISHEGGKDPDRIRPLASRDALEDALSAFADFETEGLHSVGDVVVDHQTLVSYDAKTARRLDIVVLDACIDVGAVDLLDDAGHSTISKDRVARQVFRLKFDVVSNSLVVSSREKIDGISLCG